MGVERCRCPRCREVVPRRGGSVLAKALFVGSWLFLLPWASMLALSGAGVFLFAPIVAALGCSIIAAFRDAAFPAPVCELCGCALDDAPRVEPERARPSLRRQVPVG